MWRSKVNVSLFKVLLVALPLILTGCFETASRSENQRYEDGEMNVASFKVESVEGFTTHSGFLSPVWKIPRRRFVKLTACLKTVANPSEIKGQPFKVKADDQIYNRVSDSSGCITWSERIAYPFFGNAKYISYHRTIVGTGIYKGERNIEVAVNPWADLHNIKDEVIYIKKRNADGSQSYIPKEFLADTSKGEAAAIRALRFDFQSLPLWMDNLGIHIVKLGQVESKKAFGVIEDGVRLEINVQMMPKVLLPNFRGGVVRKKLEAGKFRVFTQLIATDFGEDGSEKLVLLPDNPSHVATVNPNTGAITVPIRTRLNRRVAEGVLRLAVRVLPLEGPTELKGFEGLYLLGEYNQIRGKKVPFFTPIQKKDGSATYKDFDLDEYLKDQSLFKDLVRQKRAFKNDNYELGTMDIKWLQVQPGETATTRTIEYRVKTCVTDMMTGSKMRDLTFKVRRIRVKDTDVMPQNPVDKPVIDVTTDESGCLSWVDEVTHKYYRPEVLLFPQAKISRGNFKATLGMGINPWDDKFTFGRDLRTLPKDYIRSLAEREKIDSRFFVTGYSYQTLRFGYAIDKYMNLQVKKTVLLRVEPEVLRYNSIVNGRKATERLRDGIYLMKVALTKHYIDPTAEGNKIEYETVGLRPDGSEIKAYVVKRGKHGSYKEFISPISKLVRVQSGKILSPIEFTMRDLRLMRIRNQFLIQLETVDEKKLQVLSKVSEWREKVMKVGPEGYDGLVGMISTIKDKIDELNTLKRKISQLAGSTLPGFEVESRINKLEEEVRGLEKAIFKEKRQNREILNRLASSLGNHVMNSPMYIQAQNSQIVNQIFPGITAEESHMQLPSQREIVDSPEHLAKTLFDFGVPQSVQKEITDGFKKNDFTVNPAAPVAELNKIIDEESGLAQRTFVGPMTLLLNGNQSNMRPTDSLDESFCEQDDCKEPDFFNDDFDITGEDALTLEEQRLMVHTRVGKPRKGPTLRDRARKVSAPEDRQVFVDNSKYDHSKYFGSLRYLSDMNVNKLIERKKVLEANYRKNMKYRSLIHDFVDRENLTYVSIENNDPLKRFDSKHCKIVRDDLCLVDSMEKQVFVNEILERVNKYLPMSRPKFRLEKSHLLDLVEKGPEVLQNNPNLSEALCTFLSRDLVEKIYGKEENREIEREIWAPYGHGNVVFGSKKRRTYLKLLRDCTEGAVDDPSSVFALDRKIRVEKTGEYRFKGGKSMNINVAGNNSLNHNEGASTGASVTAALGLIPGLGLLGDFGSRVMRISWDSSRARQDSLNLQEATFLVMQTASIDIELTEHEKCLVIDFSHEMKSRGYLKSVIETRMVLKDWKPNELATGFLFCTGKVDNDPTAIRERYYYFTQHFTDGDMLDSGDLYNHPWLLMLRGARDFRYFIGEMKGFKNVILTDLSMARIWDQNAGMVLEDEAWALQRLAKTYQNIKPSFPGIYTILDESYEKADYPWPSDPLKSFDKHLAKIGVGGFDKTKFKCEYAKYKKTNIDEACGDVNWKVDDKVELEPERVQE